MSFISLYFSDPVSLYSSGIVLTQCSRTVPVGREQNFPVELGAEVKFQLYDGGVQADRLAGAVNLFFYSEYFTVRGNSSPFLYLFCTFVQTDNWFIRYLDLVIERMKYLF